MRRALVCGAGGFIGGHLAKYLKKHGYWVRAVDIKRPEFSPSVADEFALLDLRVAANCTMYDQPERRQQIGHRGHALFDHFFKMAIWVLLWLLAR